MCDVSLVAGGGASVGIDMVGLSSTGVFVGGVSDPSNIEGKLQSGDQILAINGRTVGGYFNFYTSYSHMTKYLHVLVHVLINLRRFKGDFTVVLIV